MPYYLFPILCFLAFLIERNRQRKAYIVLVFVACLAVILAVGFRSLETGTDTLQYVSFYSMWVPRIEFGFNFVTSIFRGLGASFVTFSVFYITATLLCKIFVYRKLSYSLAISLMVSFGFWLLVYDFNGIRQGLSVGVVGIAAYFAYLRNLKKYLLFVFIAGSLHYSSFIFLPFYFLLNIKIGKAPLVILTAFFLILNSLGLSSQMIDFVSSFAGDYVLRKATAYSSLEEYNANAFFSFSNIHRIGIFLLTVFTVDKIPADERLKRFFMIAAFLNITIFLFLSHVELIATRGSLPFRFIETIFLSYLPSLANNRLIYFFYGLILLLYVCLQIMVVLQDPDGNLIPYRSVIFN